MILPRELAESFADVLRGSGFLNAQHLVIIFFGRRCHRSITSTCFTPHCKSVALSLCRFGENRAVAVLSWKHQLIVIALADRNGLRVGSQRSKMSQETCHKGT